jgi:hypothetical protein
MRRAGHNENSLDIRKGASDSYYDIQNDVAFLEIKILYGWSSLHKQRPTLCSFETYSQDHSAH